MILGRISKTAAVLLCLTASMALAVPQPSDAQPQVSSIGQGFGPAYDPQKEVTLTGTLIQFVSAPVPGGPGGLHMQIQVSGETVDVHLGPHFSKQNREALKPGQLVQVVGVKAGSTEKSVVLARQLIFAGRLVTVRNTNGFLVRESEPRHSTDESNHTISGGIQ
jgi:hypothetical protein